MNNLGYHLASTVQLSSDQEEDSKEIKSCLCFKSEGKVDDEVNSPNLMAREKKEDVSLLCSLNKSSNPQCGTLLVGIIDLFIANN